jgi:hypothetical protein
MYTLVCTNLRYNHETRIKGFSTKEEAYEYFKTYFLDEGYEYDIESA